MLTWSKDARVACNLNLDDRDQERFFDFFKLSPFPNRHVVHPKGSCKPITRAYSTK